MSLLSKLFGEDSILGYLLKGNPDSEERHVPAEPAARDAAEPVMNKPENTIQQDDHVYSSYGSVMPAVENQFSFSGSYQEYFSSIFSSEFPQYRVVSEPAYRGRATVFTFWEGDRKALVVEIISEKSSVYKLRSDCAKAGVPYLRYYYDHPGWWNTRVYVTERTRKALMG